MRFMVIRKADAETEQGCMPSNELIAQMAAFNNELANAGVLIDGTGLQPSKEGARISFSNGQALVTDGPFTETKELVAGFTMIEVKDKAEAIEWMKRWPALDGGGNAQLELRRLYELSDFEPGSGIADTHKVFEKITRQPQSCATYLTFDGRCREAFEFYAELLGGEINVMQTFAALPLEENNADEHGCAGVITDADRDKIMHACLTYGKGTLMGSDAMPGQYQQPQGFYQQLQIDDMQQAIRVFNALSEGGSVHMPFGETFWAEGFGMLVDAWGIPWMVNSGFKAPQ